MRCGGGWSSLKLPAILFLRSKLIQTICGPLSGTVLATKDDIAIRCKRSSTVLQVYGDNAIAEDSKQKTFIVLRERRKDLGAPLVDMMDT